MTPSRPYLSALLIAAAVLAMFAPAPEGLSTTGWRAGVLAILMASLWMTETLPLAATALIPLVMFPLAGVAEMEAVAQSYAHPLIFLFLGGFILAAGMKKWQLHNYAALIALRWSGSRPDLQILAIMSAAAFLSLWISNTATAMVMMPIGLSMIAAAEEGLPANEGGDAESHDIPDSTPNSSQFGSALMLGIAFAATIGGMGSLIGTPPNAFFAAFVQNNYGVTIGFAQWMLVGIPLVLVLIPMTWLMLTRVSFTMPASIHSAAGADRKLPALSRDQKVVAIVLCATALSWVTRPLIADRFAMPGLSDSGIAMAGALALFLLPARGEGRQALLDWDDVKTIRWDVLILFGGGLALADGIRVSGLAEWIGAAISQFRGMPLPLLVLITMTVVVYLGELASNTAMAAVFLPVAAAGAAGLGVAPLELLLPVALAASLGFMLPVATPPNAIVYGSGAVTARQMLRAGALLDVISILVVFAIALTLGPLVIPI
ncbi:MAG: hypothetical protein RLZ98_3131 [Pseudomonadota bacterium]|jgi:sodium-dependent dicarboxylate transporter 2/3/5